MIFLARLTEKTQTVKRQSFSAGFLAVGYSTLSPPAFRHGLNHKQEGRSYGVRWWQQTGYIPTQFQIIFGGYLQGAQNGKFAAVTDGL